MKDNKSERIRQLHDAGLNVAEIAKLLGIRYQFAYNVVTFHVQQKRLEVLENATTGVPSDSDVRLVPAQGSHIGSLQVG